MTQAGHSETRPHADAFLHARAVNHSPHARVSAEEGDGFDHLSIEHTLKRERQLNALTQILHSAHDIHSVMPNVLRMVAELVEADAVALPLIRRDTETLEFCYTLGVPESLLATKVPRGANLSWQIIEHQLPVLINGYHHHERALQSLVAHDVRAVIGTPVAVDEQPVGVLAVYRIGRDDPFTAHDLNILTVVGRQIGLTIDRIQRYQTAVQEAERRIALLYASQQIGATLDLPHLYRTIHQAITTLIPCESFALMLIDSGSNRLDVVYCDADAHDPAEHIVDEAVAQVLAGGQSLCVAGGGQNTRLLIVMRRGGQTLGVMSARTRASHICSATDLEMLDQLATTAAIAIENARLFEAARREADMRTRLYEASQRLGALLDLNQIYDEIYRATMSLVTCDGFLVALKSGEQAPPGVIYCVGRAYSKACANLAHRAIEKEESLRCDNTECGSSVLVAVMRRGGRVIGAILVRASQPYTYTDADRSALELLGATAAIAIDNARLFADARRHATIDELTGVWNRRSFFENARREFLRSQRTLRPLAVLMFDIDHFKSVNDTYGHAVGDQALRDLAERCRNQLRGIDIIGRYGGEEFAVALPDTDIDAAEHIAERLRTAVENTPFATAQGSISLTISIGVAVCHPDDQTTLDAIIDRADRALYLAKRSGRNSVRVWSYSAKESKG
ncbi:diguanylate cyclase [Roseiflexus castenholzii DSM 13941]|uniref:Diguanylate cyclase n=1 Tax=Roseiflexus castenholzii (strain DSM 13941 / HLO8) TaxID=383372 RepID=A7NHB7_ROSCS|nr:diguanylate cyclase [Roseiflexus castenholzii DSM 13941]